MYKKLMKMKLLLLCLFVTNLFAYDITTGGSSGTYIKFGNQIKEHVADSINLPMNVLQSSGSIDNIKKLTYNENVKFAIVQHDVINDFKNSNDKNFNMLARNIKVLLPLYNEEIHVIARKNSPMKYIRDIKNKRINAGEKNSGTLMTTTLLYRELFQEPMSHSKAFYDKKSIAFEKLQNGQVDVVVIVAGQPSETIENLSRYNFKLLQRHPSTRSNTYYGEENNIKIKANSYSWINSDIPTLAVKAYLVTYDNSSKEFENNMRKFAKKFRKSMPQLRSSGHAKWQKVSEDLSGTLQAGWEYYEPFRDAWKYAKCTEEDLIMGIPCGDK